MDRLQVSKASVSELVVQSLGQRPVEEYDMAKALAHEANEAFVEDDFERALELYGQVRKWCSRRADAD